MEKCSVLFPECTNFLNGILMSFDFTTHHTKVVTLILSLSKGRAGIAWVSSNKKLFLPPPKAIKRLSRSP
jgi:hypothetical protein